METVTSVDAYKVSHAPRVPGSLALRWDDTNVGITNRAVLRRQQCRHVSLWVDFLAFDCPTDRGLIRQEYECYLPLPRLGEGRGEALAVR